MAFPRHRRRDPAGRAGDDHFRGAGVPGSGAAQDDGYDREAESGAEARFPKQFKSPDEYQQYMQTEMQRLGDSNCGNRSGARMLIEQIAEDGSGRQVRRDAGRSEGLLRQESGEIHAAGVSSRFQSISVVPPLKPTARRRPKRRRKQAEDALRQAKATKSYQDFGLLAEKISEDDFRVNMGDHKVVGRDKLPPQVVKAFADAAGQVTGLIQIESAYTIIRLNAHTPAEEADLRGSEARH